LQGKTHPYYEKRETMIVEKNLQKDYELAVPAELLRMAHLSGRVRIIVDEREIIIRKAKDDKDDLFQKMLGLGKDIFETDSVTLQRDLRAEWNI
jgi:hypothetical protein